MDLRERIAHAEQRAGRAPGSVKLLPVSKTQPPERIREVFRDDASLPKRLGENYVDELLAKHAALGTEFEWHFIGRIQSRRIAEICSVADLIHTVARAKEIEAIARSPRASRVRFFLQVNVSGETQKNGCEPGEIPALLEACARAGIGAQVAGLMALPASLGEISEGELRRQFGNLRALRDQYLPRGELSMGMSADLEIAIEEGADWVRVGTAIFGERG